MSELATLLLSVAALVTALATGIAAILTAMSTRREIAAQGIAMTAQGLNIQKIETATNSMKDALVQRTAEASEAKGRDDQRALQATVDQMQAKAEPENPTVLKTDTIEADHIVTQKGVIVKET